jgi:dihydrofolate reductase
MLVSIIVAMDANNGIATEEEKIPWMGKIPDDMKRFREKTMGHHVIFGRTTWDTIKNPLKGRKAIVLTRQPEIYKTKHKPVLVTDTLEEAYNFALEADESELLIAGGSQIYEQTIDFADRIYLTEVLKSYNCNKFFPKIDYSQWEVVEEEIKSTETLDYNFKTLERVTKP